MTGSIANSTVDEASVLGRPASVVDIEGRLSERLAKYGEIKEEMGHYRRVTLEEKTAAGNTVGDVTAAVPRINRFRKKEK